MEYTLKEILGELCKIQDDVRWAAGYAFLRDPICGRFTMEERISLSEKAISYGRKMADQIITQYGKISAEDFCRILDLEVKKEAGGYRGGEVRYAEFREPGEVVIYEECIKQAEQTLLDEELGSLSEAGFLREKQIGEVLLSHEIFHYLEYQEGDAAFTRTFRHKRKGAVRWLPGAKVMCLSEIAAMAFVKTFQGLPFSPYVYDVYLVWGCNRDAAYAVYAAVMGPGRYF